MILAAAGFGRSLPAPGFAIVLADETDDVVVLAVHGEIDVGTAPQLRERLGEHVDRGARRVVLDLAHTTFMDSSGIRALLATHRALEPRGGRLALVAPGSGIADTLRVTGLDELWPVLATREEALAALAATPGGAGTRRDASD